MNKITACKAFVYQTLMGTGKVGKEGKECVYEIFYL